MKISELQPKQGNVEVTGELLEVGEARTFNKFGKDGSVANAVMKDDSGQVMSMSWISGMLSSKQAFDVSLSWNPESQGSYMATVFVWDDLRDPLPLSEPESIPVIVA